MIFADTSFWIAARFKRDAHHEEAASLLQQVGGARIVTSNHVRGETWTFLRRRDGHRTAVVFLDMLDRSARVDVLNVSEELEAQALRWLRRHDEREYSFVDATSFALMRSMRIREALAFDGDFAAAGFVELRLERRGTTTSLSTPDSAPQSYRGRPRSCPTIAGELGSLIVVNRWVRGLKLTRALAPKSVSQTRSRSST